jgi:hypothetical protein
MLEKYQYLLSDPIFLIAAFLLTLAVVLLVYATLYWLKGKAVASGTHPAFVALLDKAITIAYKSSEYMLDAIGTRLSGLKKLSLAENVYDVLPDELLIKILGLYFDISWKEHVPKAVFVKFVDARFDWLLSEFEEFEESVLSQM